jgi:multidrug efflux pump subunit AcrB
MVRPFFRNIRLLVLTLILIVGWGLSSYQSLPRQEDPELVSRVAVVTTAFPGASAERVEALVTTVLEEELAEIEEIDTLASTSRVGFSSITIELEDSVKDARPIWARVRDKMDDAAKLFPPGTTDPELSDLLLKAYTFVPSVTWDLPGDPNYAILRRYARELGVALRGVGGVEAVDYFGDPIEEILVEINAPELVGVGLSVQEVATQINLSDAKTSAGLFRSTGQSLAIEVDNELQTLEQIRQIPIQSQNGQFTRLGDIASVSRGIRDPLTHQAIIGGQPAVVLGVMMQSGLRIDQWGAQARSVIEDFRSRLPDGIRVDVIFDQSGYVENRISGLMLNLVIGAGLVIGVTLVSMGWRSALLVGSALPLTVCVVLGAMTVLGVPIHQMSVTGLIIALGLLIDNAIVVVDEVQMEIAHGMDPLSAALKTVNYLKVPLLASTITTILTFLPIYLLPGAAGEFVGTIALGVILALIGSLGISLTLIAALAARVLGSHHQRQQSYPDHHSNGHGSGGIPQPWWESGISLPFLARPYAWTLAQATRKPILALVLTLSIPIAGFAAAGTLENQFFPSLDRDQFQVEMEFSSQTSIQQTSAEVLRARDVILAHDEVEEVYWFVGQSAARFYYNVQGGRENEPAYAQAMVQLKSPKGVEALARRLQVELDQQFPTARVIVRKFEQGPQFDAPVEMRIYGPNLEELRRLGMEVRGLLNGIPDVTHVRDGLTTGQPKLSLALDPEQVRQAGLSNTEVAQQLDAYSEGVTGGSILESTEDLPIRVRLANADRASLQVLVSLDLRPQQDPQDRSFRPLSSLGSFELVPQLTQITRRNEQRVNTVQAFLKPGVLPSTVLTAFQDRLEQAQFQLPPGYRYEFGGEAEQQDTAMGNLLLFLPLLLLGMVIALVLSLGSFRLAAIIGVVAISSIGMAMLSLKIFGSVLGFMAIVGTMGLIGIAINDSIVVLSAFGEDPEAKRGDPRAVQRVVLKATRHVLTTTATTIIGFVPLLVEGDPFWMPLSLAISGGMTGATLMALYFVPAAYVLIKRKSFRAKGKQSKILIEEQPNQQILQHSIG